MGWDGIPKSQPSQDGYIYFLQLGNRIKIGWSSDPHKRIKSLPGRLIGLHPGSMTDERALHARFARIRDHKEWFEDGDDLVEYITRHASVSDGESDFRRAMETAWGDQLIDVRVFDGIGDAFVTEGDFVVEVHYLIEDGDDGIFWYKQVDLSEGVGRVTVSDLLAGS